MASRYLRKKKPPGLMLTSLLDMFTIILIFLIVSFEAEDQDFRLDPDISLPDSAARSVFMPAVSVNINPGRLVVEGETVVPLDDGRFTAEHYQSGQIEELVTVLTQHFERGDFDEPIVMIQADREMDYQTLYLVMRSSSLAGFSRYRLAIMKN